MLKSKEYTRLQMKKAKHTYFIRGGQHVKVGESDYVPSRLRQLQTAYPYRLILLKTSNIEEQEAHRLAEQLAPRHKGEWFEATQELLAWIDSLPEMGAQLPSTSDWIAEYERMTEKISAPLDHVEWADMNAVAKYFGLNKGVQYRLIQEGKIRSCSLCNIGRRRGKRLLCLHSIRLYLNFEADAEAIKHSTAH